MFNKILSAALSLCFMILFSCSSEDAALESATNPNFDLAKISGSKWALDECPGIPLLTINGYSECAYFESMEFVGDKVYIKHSGNPTPTLHHICYVNGKELVVSIQDCSNTTWRSLFEWNVSSYTGSGLVFDMTTPNISIGYQGKFAFKRL
ncbi:MAG: hypothetical protein R2728_06190 [Chitinophagales bacterium]